MSDISITHEGHVATIVIDRPPHNYFDVELIRDIASALEHIDEDVNLRSVVLAAEGKSFCAGANFTQPKTQPSGASGALHLYEEALRIFACKKPIVAAVQGPAIGGGLGLALTADFRIACAETRFAANFTRIGFHPGFGLTVTLPELVGCNNAELLFYTSRRIDGQEALKLGLANELVALDQVRTRATALAHEIAECSPLGLLTTRATMRAGLVDRIRAATRHELAVQDRLKTTNDFAEGVKSSAERRSGNFIGK
ncbi:enoyl-CoA hydratase/isomerase family protein [Acidovorax sp. JHL-9]|uniref:enoyl-CoA hydratase/isomerase family protein n=1 Tax=Acidovorax sp. JHL-9 TaxID=1276756 RepID=UPI0004224307|nr:enoyl-CoA hydratase/isomerase family protein [Acidovorax sp. JHL-9]